MDAKSTLLKQKLENLLSRLIQAERASEVVIAPTVQIACPDCARMCNVATEQRTANSMDGPIEITETQSSAACRTLKSLVNK